MTRVGRKRYHNSNLHIKKKYKGKRRTRYMDEIHEDMKPENAEKLLHQDVDLDKPGCGQHYCLHCARYFIDLQSLKAHFRSKQHKRRGSGMDRTELSTSQASSTEQIRLEEEHEEMRPDGSQSSVLTAADDDDDDDANTTSMPCINLTEKVYASPVPGPPFDILIRWTLKALEEEPYTQKEAEAAAGLGTYKPPTKKEKVVTQEVSEDTTMGETKD